MTEGEEHLPTIKQELVKMVETEGSVTYDTKSSITEVDTNVPKKTRVSGLCQYFSNASLYYTFYLHIFQIYEEFLLLCF